MQPTEASRSVPTPQMPISRVHSAPRARILHSVTWAVGGSCPFGVTVTV